MINDNEELKSPDLYHLKKQKFVELLAKEIVERRKHYRTDTGLLYLRIANLAGADNAKQLVPS